MYPHPQNQRFALAGVSWLLDTRKDAMKTKKVVCEWQGAPYCRRYDREPVSKPAILWKRSWGGYRGTGQFPLLWCEHALLHVLTIPHVARVLCNLTPCVHFRGVSCLSHILPHHPVPRSCLLSCCRRCYRRVPFFRLPFFRKKKTPNPRRGHCTVVNVVNIVDRNDKSQPSLGVVQILRNFSAPSMGREGQYRHHHHHQHHHHPKHLVYLHVIWLRTHFFA